MNWGHSGKSAHLPPIDRPAQPQDGLAHLLNSRLLQGTSDHMRSLIWPLGSHSSRQNMQTKPPALEGAEQSSQLRPGGRCSYPRFGPRLLALLSVSSTSSPAWEVQEIWQECSTDGGRLSPRTGEIQGGRDTLLSEAEASLAATKFARKWPLTKPGRQPGKWD